MSIRSLTVIGAAFALGAWLTVQAPTREEQCAVALMKVDLIEECGEMLDCIISELERRDLIEYKTEVIKYCEPWKKNAD